MNRTILTPLSVIGPFLPNIRKSCEASGIKAEDVIKDLGLSEGLDVEKYDEFSANNYKMFADMDEFYASLRKKLLLVAKKSKDKPTLSYVFAAKNSKARNFLKKTFDLVDASRNRFLDIDAMETGYFADSKNIMRAIGKSKEARMSQLLGEQASEEERMRAHRIAKVLNRLLAADALAMGRDVVMRMRDYDARDIALINRAKESKDYKTRLFLIDSASREKSDPLDVGTMKSLIESAQSVTVAWKAKNADKPQEIASIKGGDPIWEVTSNLWNAFQRQNHALIGAKPKRKQGREPLVLDRAA